MMYILEYIFWKIRLEIGESLILYIKYRLHFSMIMKIYLLHPRQMHFLFEGRIQENWWFAQRYSGNPEWVRWKQSYPKLLVQLMKMVCFPSILSSKNSQNEILYQKLESNKTWTSFRMVIFWVRISFSLLTHE